MSQFFLNIYQDGLAYPRLVAAYEAIEEMRQEARAVFADLARGIVSGAAKHEWQIGQDTGRLVYKIKLTIDTPD